MNSTPSFSRAVTRASPVSARTADLSIGCLKALNGWNLDPLTPIKTMGQQIQGQQRDEVNAGFWKAACTSVKQWAI
jgi:hypothetical protein